MQLAAAASTVGFGIERNRDGVLHFAREHTVDEVFERVERLTMASDEDSRAVALDIELDRSGFRISDCFDLRLLAHQFEDAAQDRARLASLLAHVNALARAFGRIFHPRIALEFRARFMRTTTRAVRRRGRVRCTSRSRVRTGSRVVSWRAFVTRRALARRFVMAWRSLVTRRRALARRGVMAARRSRWRRRDAAARSFGFAARNAHACLTHAESEHARSRGAQDFDRDVVLLRAKLRERLPDGFVHCGGGFFD